MIKISESYIILDGNDEKLDIIFKNKEDALGYIYNNLPKNMRDFFRAEPIEDFIISPN